MLDVRGELGEVLVQTEGETATYLVALLFAREAGDCTVEGSRGGYDEAGEVLEAGRGEDVGLDARMGGLGRGRGGAIEDEDGRAREQLVCGVEEGEVGGGERGGLWVDDDHAGDWAQTSDLRGKQGRAN